MYNEIMSFIVDAPEWLKQVLLPMGLPTAGIEYEVTRNRAVFGGLLEVTRDGNFYIDGRRVSMEEFIKACRLYANYGEDFTRDFIEYYGLKDYKIFRGGKIKYSWLAWKGRSIDDFAREFSLFGISIKDGKPSGVLPVDVSIVYDVSNTTPAVTLEYRRGDIKIIVGWPLYMPMYFYRDAFLCTGFDGEAHPLPEVLERWTVSDVVKMLKELEKPLRNCKKFEKNGWNICTIDEPMRGLAAIKRTAKLSGEIDLEEIEAVAEKIDWDYVDFGWSVEVNKFANRAEPVYRKEISNMRIEKFGEFFSLQFSNGVVLFDLPAEIIVPWIDIDDLFRMLLVM